MSWIPESILELTLRHPEPISLLEIQNALLVAQAKLINPEHITYPKCRQPLSHNDYKHQEWSQHRQEVVRSALDATIAIGNPLWRVS